VTYEERSVTISVVIELPLLRDGFSATLTSFGHHVLSSHSNGRELMASLSADKVPEIVLIDVLRTEAIEAMAWLREHHPSVRVLALCSSSELPLVQPLLDRGAAGFLFIHDFSSDIKAAIREVLTNGSYVRPAEPYRMHN
jgi:two-component system, NarL family, invasion response regulator UvrY